MSLLCMFLPNHDLEWRFNIRPHPCWNGGVYQCRRCKLITTGETQSSVTESNLEECSK